MDLMYSLKFGAVFFGGIFHSYASYSSFVEHPSRSQCNTIIAVTQFQKGFRTVAAFQGVFALLGGGCQIALYAITKKVAWLISGTSLLLVLPYTLFVMMPVNNILLDEKALEGVPENKEKTSILEKAHHSWGYRHIPRVVLGLISAIVPLLLVLRN